MIRLLTYAVFFYLGYRVLKMLFGDRGQQYVRGNNPDGMSMRQPPPPDPQRNSDDGEYIEYEEVK